MRESYLTPNRWLAERLKMGTAKSVSSPVSFHRDAENGSDKQWIKLKMFECVDPFFCRFLVDSTATVAFSWVTLTPDQS